MNWAVEEGSHPYELGLRGLTTEMSRIVAQPVSCWCDLCVCLFTPAISFFSLLLPNFSSHTSCGKLMLPFSL